MTHQEGSLDNGLFWQSWRAVDQPTAIVVIAHGLAEHSARYAHVAGALNNAGFVVFALDHLGHGRSPGARCVVERFEQYLDGVDALYDAAKREFDLPVHILGHSMGGLIAGHTLLRYPDRYQSAVLTGPAVVAPEPPPAWQEFIVRLLARWAPTLGVVALEGEAISRDADVVQRYFDDPLVYNGKIPARLAAELFDAMTVLRDHAHEITTPLLVMHGSADRLTAPQGGELLVERAASAHKKFWLVPDAYHELFNEPDQAAAIAAMCDWYSAQG